MHRWFETELLKELEIAVVGRFEITGQSLSISTPEHRHNDLRCQAASLYNGVHTHCKQVGMRHLNAVLMQLLADAVKGTKSPEPVKAESHGRDEHCSLQLLADVEIRADGPEPDRDSSRITFTQDLATANPILNAASKQPLHGPAATVICNGKSHQRIAFKGTCQNMSGPAARNVVRILTGVAGCDSHKTKALPDGDGIGPAVPDDTG